MSASNKSRGSRFLAGKKRKDIALAAGAVVLVAVAIGAIIHFLWPDATVTATKEEAVAALQNPDQIAQLPDDKRRAVLKAYGKAMSADITTRGPGPDPKMREMEEKLSPEDRRAFHDGMRENMHKAMRAKVAAFFKATPEEQEKLIAEEVARMKEMREKMEENRKEGKEGGGPGGPGGPRNESREQREEHMRGMLANSNPTERAQMQEYMRRVRAAGGGGPGPH